jgi:hypothetical protein
LIVVSPLGVRGNPYDPERFDSVSLLGDDVVLGLGRGHVQYVRTAAGMTAVRPGRAGRTVCR